MNQIHTIVQDINQNFLAKSEVRDDTLKLSRELIRFCANAIRATHRGEAEQAADLLASAEQIAAEMVKGAGRFSDIYHAGYTQDALKEFAEANLTRAFILEQPLPTPQSLHIENAAYINGMAETVGELRRYALDALRRGDMAAGERALNLMDEIYTALITVDFPAAITRDLRRKTDIARGILERTRGDVTTAVRQEAMKKALAAFEDRLSVD